MTYWIQEIDFILFNWKVIGLILNCSHVDTNTLESSSHLCSCPTTVSLRSNSVKESNLRKETEAFRYNN